MRLSPLFAYRWALEAEYMENAKNLLLRDLPARGGYARPSDHGEERSAKEEPYKVYGGVAVIRATGPMFRHADGLRAMCGDTLVSYERLHECLERAVDDRAVSAILLRLDSPGGEVGGCEPLAADIRAVDAKKPVVAFADGLACSAAYWLASASRKIVCGPASVLGSIGVRATLIDRSRAMEETGIVEIEIVSSRAPNKRATPFDKDVRARVQAELDALEDVFVSQVATFRGVSPDVVLEKYGAGGVMVGKAALDAGLADQMGTYGAALDAAREFVTKKQFSGVGLGPIAHGDAPKRAQRSTKMNQSLAERLEALATHDSLQGNAEARHEIGALVAVAKQQDQDLFSARAKLTDAIARAEGLEYEALMSGAKQPRRDGNGKPVAGPKITGPAHEAQIRENFTTSADLKKYLAVASEAPLTVAEQGLRPQADPAKHVDPKNGASRARIESAMDGVGASTPWGGA